MESWTPPAVPALPGHGPDLRLHDTATGGALTVTGPGAERATMYVCGITPYDATHLGHAATMITFDLVHRYWLDQGLDVNYAQNVTDVDEPLFERAERDGTDWQVLGLRETALYREDMESLGIVPPRHFVGAVETIPLVGKAVAELLDKGAAYRHESGDIYYSVTEYIDANPAAASISSYDSETMIRYARERGGDPDREGKRHPLDPILWNAPREGEPSWDSAVGPGRPGWHIECTCIAIEHLGATIDVQGGGNDLIYPHHEMSAAHAESLTGELPFARAYVHTGMIGLDGEKMSKSLGNLVFVSKLRAQDVDPAAVRLALLADHYRSDRQWAPATLAEAELRLGRWREAVSRELAVPAGAMLTAVRNRLADDLDTAGALTAVDDWASETLSAGGDDPSAPALARDTIEGLLGIDCSRLLCESPRLGTLDNRASPTPHAARGVAIEDPAAGVSLQWTDPACLVHPARAGA
ncbi:cysteine--1-D-myo-inosityl 2-amino-2-deoxy-alpha-D-glucopyranoside ligase [Glycomyces sp. L485]|uniref:cysteine--1-D-myo-inosityl 2-amino-2-deoxy-alpha-D-glucopyranoside ligase n=1 Tax=Glycomyces sp. L485 TaxID=2909235 RepID=UPI001F4A2268|nr:cysteine--1-D-myo-inosityl 2-amino-2-deoxy-alpha-D-glucopyranoside ligase [Glycomyces sp. L485]MCH7232684.1 cysteine--1-D-myo-inosityl 2-amino-2-deoxy-alpha-D-glucopyranoside ligase [Glycomyces sp. L485]